jgi:hypothetical protein
MPARNDAHGLKRLPKPGGFFTWYWAASQISRLTANFRPRTVRLWHGQGEPDAEAMQRIERECATLNDDLRRWMQQNPDGRQSTHAARCEGTIYFAKCGSFVKIGFSAKADLRLRDLQIGSPEPIEMIGWMRGTARGETWLHRHFGRYRVRGEWFAAAPALLDFIASATPPGEPPAATYLAQPIIADGPEHWD